MASTPTRLVNHLFWRAGMGLTPSELGSLSLKSYDDLVDGLFRSAKEFTPIVVLYAAELFTTDRRGRCS